MTPGKLRQGMFYLLLSTSLGLALHLGERYAVSWDTTAGGQNSLHPGSAELLGKLPDPIAFTAFIPDYPVLRKNINKLVKKYQQHHPRVSLNFVDPTIHPEQARQLGVRHAGELLIEYQGRSSKLGNITEQGVSNALAKLSMEHTDWIINLSGHGEASLHGKANFDLGNFGSLLTAKGYRFFEHNLLASGDLPHNMGLLLLAAPSSELADSEQKLVLQYLENGGNLLWLAEGKIPEKLANHLGFGAMPGTVVDAAAADLGIDTPTVAVAARHPDHPVTASVSGPVLLPRSKALAVIDNKNSWEAYALLQTGTRSWNETGELTGTIQRDQQQQEMRGPLDVGYALTRARPDGSEQRAVVIGDADFLSNAYLGNASNRALGLSLAHWLTANEHLVSIPPRQAKDQQLKWQATTSAAIAAFYLIALPLLLAVSGLLIAIRRKRA